MKKLRQTLERRNDEAVDTDLRGLASDGILERSHPIAVLSIIAKSFGETELNKKIEPTGWLLLKSQLVENCFHIVVSDKAPGHHKEDAVKLYFWSLNAAFNEFQGVSILLWQCMTLRELMKSAIKGKRPTTSLLESIDRSIDEGMMTTSGYLRVDKSSAHHLRQAGFKIPESHADEIILSHAEAKDLFLTETKESSSQLDLDRKLKVK